MSAPESADLRPPADPSFNDRMSSVKRLARVLGIRGPLLARAVAGNLLPGHRIDPEWLERYERSRKDLRDGDPVFRPAKQWRLISSLFRLMMGGFGLDDFKATFGRFLAAYEPDNPRYFEALHHLYWSSLRRRDTWNLLDRLEEPDLGHGDTIAVGGKRVSIDLLQSVDEFYRLRETLGFEQNDAIAIAEIGAGYGRLAHVVLAAMPNARYFIFDLPESLLLSQYYLTKIHPGVPALLYPESVDADEKRWATERLVFGLPHQLKNVPRDLLDCVVNIYSFMEMSKGQVDAYFDVIEAINPSALFIKQHKHEVNVLEQSLLTSKGYPVRPSWKLAYEGTSELFEDVFEAIYRIR